MDGAMADHFVLNLASGDLGDHDRGAYRVRRSFLAFRAFRHGSTDDGKNKAAVELGRKGGQARAKELSKKRRAEIAKKAAQSRWGRG